MKKEKSKRCALLETRAEQLAREIHSGDVRIISRVPYIYHPQAVVHTLKELHYGPIIIATGWLHDGPEDHPETWPFDDVLDRLDCQGADRVVRNVRTLTYDPTCLSRVERYERYREALAENPEAMPVALADKDNNLADIETNLKFGIPVFGANYLNCDPREEIKKWLAIAAVCLDRRHNDPGIKILYGRVMTLIKSIKSILTAKKVLT